MRAPTRSWFRPTAWATTRTRIATSAYGCSPTSRRDDDGPEGSLSGGKMSNEDIVRKVLAHITAAEYEQLGAYVTEDLRFELPYAGPPIPDHFDGRAVWDGMQRQ